MGRINISIDGVLGNASSMQTQAYTIGGIRSNISGISGSIDGKIKARYNIEVRLGNVVNQINDAESRLHKIIACMKESAISYDVTELRIINEANSIYGVHTSGKPSGSTTSFNNDVFFTEARGDLQPIPKEKSIEGHIYDFLEKDSMTARVVDTFHKITKWMPEKNLVYAGAVLRNGLSFSKKLGPGGKVLLELDNFKGRTYKQLAENLDKYITKTPLVKYDVKGLTRGEFTIYNKMGHANFTKGGKAFSDGILNEAKEYLELDKAIANMNHSKLSNAACAFGSKFLEELNYGKKIGQLKADIPSVLDWKDFSKLSNIEKVDDVLKKADTVLDGLGIVGDIVSVGTNIVENNFNHETQKFEFTPKSVVNTVTDVAVDAAVGAGAAATGAAVGSCFLPPLGTVVGAGVGLAVGFAVEAAVIDWDGDGKKDSLVDGAKMAVDAIVDGFWGIFS